MSSIALEKESPLAFLFNNSIVAALADTYTSFSQRREALGLPNPGTVENIAREVQRDVFLNNYTFSGLRADLTKPFSMSPLFQVSHAFSMGSQGLPPYAFAALFGTNKVRDGCIANAPSWASETCPLWSAGQHMLTDSLAGLHAGKHRQWRTTLNSVQLPLVILPHHKDSDPNSPGS